MQRKQRPANRPSVDRFAKPRMRIKSLGDFSSKTPVEDFVSKQWESLVFTRNAQSVLERGSGAQELLLLCAMLGRNYQKVCASFSAFRSKRTMATPSRNIQRVSTRNKATFIVTRVPMHEPRQLKSLTIQQSETTNVETGCR